MNADEYISSRLDDQLAWYDKKSSGAQAAFKRLRTLEFILAASIPFLAVLPFANTAMFNILVAAIGLLIAIITSLHGLYRWNENWIEYRCAAEALTREKLLFLTGAAPYADSDSGSNFKRLVSRVEGLLAKENGNWSQLMNTSEEETEKPKKPI